MSQTTLNPYPLVGAFYGGAPPGGSSNGLDYIINNIPISPPPAVSDLVYWVTTFINNLGLLPITTSIQLQIASVAYSTINSYVNGLITSKDSSLYGTAQNSFIDLMIGRPITNYITVDSVNNKILDIEDNISKSGLTVEEQTPLLLATMIGQRAYTYLIGKIASPGNWNSFFTAAKVSATANLPFWVAASMEGALIGAHSTFRGMIETTDKKVTVEIVSALTAALTLTAGKIIFNFIPRIQDDDLNTLLTLNMQTMGNVNK